MTVHSFFPAPLILNPDQVRAVDALQDFLNESGQQIFVLRGYAGTGKTTLMKGVLDYLEDSGRHFLPMAPTGRAARVLTGKTGHPCTTVHTSIFRPIQGPDGEVAFVLRESPANGTVLLVDESSMLSARPALPELGRPSSDIETLLRQALIADSAPDAKPGTYLLNDILAFADLSQNPDTRIIFVGDNAQLPPIGLTHSPVFHEEMMQKLGFGYREAELTQVMRNDNGVLLAATRIRQQICDGKPISSYPLPSADVQAVAHGSLVEAYLRETPTPADAANSILIQQTNRKVYEANMRIRARFFPAGDPECPQPGEKLMVYANHYGDDLFFNGDSLTLLDVQEDKRFSITVDLSDAEKRRLASYPQDFRNQLFPGIRLKGDKAEVEIHLLKVKVEDADGNQSTVHCSRDFLFSELPDAHGIYRRGLIARAKQVAKQYRAECERRGVPTDADREEGLMHPYVNCLYLKFGYAITCHKAQGGEWQKVFANICTNPDRARNLEHFKWIYTAYTRSSGKLWVGVPYVQSTPTPPKKPATSPTGSGWTGQRKRSNLCIKETIPCY